jgi:hypothetical protein
MNINSIIKLIPVALLQLGQLHLVSAQQQTIGQIVKNLVNSPYAEFPYTLSKGE